MEKVTKGENNDFFLVWRTYNLLPLLDNKEYETRELLMKKAKEINIVIRNSLILKSYVFLFCTNNDNMAIEKIANLLKGSSSKQLRERHKELMDHQSLWETGYYSEMGT